MFRCDYATIMNRLDALFIQDLANLIYTEELERREINGKIYHMCTTDILANSRLKWSKSEQIYHFKSMSKYIDIIKKGIPGKRYIRIHFDLIEHDILERALKDGN